MNDYIINVWPDGRLGVEHPVKQTDEEVVGRGD